MAERPNLLLAAFRQGALNSIKVAAIRENSLPPRPSLPVFHAE
jgi:hypothetical protein